LQQFNLSQITNSSLHEIKFYLNYTVIYGFTPAISNTVLKGVYLNIGIVGSGFMGSMHANLYKKIKCAHNQGITNKSSTNAKKIADDLSIQCYQDYKKMLNDSAIDIVDICTPTDSHTLIAIESMKMNKHVILEFPAVSSLSELEELRKVSRETGKICALAYYSRFQSQYKYIFDAAISGSLGKINGLSISRKSSPVFYSDDIVNNLISQDIDFMVRLLGKPNKIHASNIKQKCAVFIFEYDCLSAVISGAVNMHKNFPFSTHHHVSGKKGSLDLSWKFTDHPEYTMTQTSENGSSNINNQDYDPYHKELEVIVEGIINNQTSAFDIESAAMGITLSLECRELLR